MSETRKITILYDAIEDEQRAEGEDEAVNRQVEAVLRERGHDVETLAATPDLSQLVRALERDESQIVFNLGEALGGNDAGALQVASVLEHLHKPFTGAGALGLSLAQDKALAKKIFAFHDLPYPKFSLMRAGEVEWSDDLQFPLFVKPADTDSSVGIDAGALVHDLKALMERISYIHTQIHAPVLIEEFIEGRELFIGVLGHGAHDTLEALPIVEWDFSKVKGPKFATAAAKWDKHSEGYKAPERFPNDIPEEVCRAMQRAAVEACKALHIYDYGRVDMRLRSKQGGRRDNPKSWEFYIIEANPNPYLEKSSEVAMAAQKSGLGYGELIEKILDSAAKRHARA
jgi:D-alanine-D-alanine ligase